MQGAARAVRRPLSEELFPRLPRGEPFFKAATTIRFCRGSGRSLSSRPPTTFCASRTRTPISPP
eukprot:11180301-Lingulodinium_polyedra.AAC.1